MIVVRPAFATTSNAYSGTVGKAAKSPFDPRQDPDVPAGMSIALLQDLHLLTREGHLNADARRKLKQIRHLLGLLRPALDDVLARYEQPTLVDCGAGKSYLGFLLYELVLGPAGRGALAAIEHRAELVARGQARATAFGHHRFTFHDTSISSATVPDKLHVVTALHACDTATDDAILLGLQRQADHIVVVPCCQAEVARQLDHAAARQAAQGAHVLFAHNLHRREFGSHLTNVTRALTLQAHGYSVAVTELVGWEHSAKNEAIIARRVSNKNPQAMHELAALLAQFAIMPSLNRQLATQR